MCSVKNLFLEISQNSLENTCVRVCNKVYNKVYNRVYNKVAGLRCSPVNIMKFLKTPSFIEHLRCLLLGLLDIISF